MTVYGDLIRYRELFGNLFRRDLQAKYRGSVLGVAWSLALPLLLMGVYVLVFSLLWHAFDIPHYALFLLSGLVTWVFFSTSLQNASRSMLENANLIKKVRFPRQLVPLSVVATQLVTFAVMLVVLICVNAIFVPRTRPTVLLSIPIAVAVVAIVCGVALAVASANVVFRDVEHITQALLLPWFFLTPVLYTLDKLPGADSHPRIVELLHWANFMTPPVNALRDPLFFGRLPRAGDAIYLCVAAVASLALGAAVFSRVDDQIAVEL